MSQLLERITPPELWEGFEKLSEHRPDLKTLLYILGRPRIFEWIHSVGVSAEDKLRALVPPVPPEELRQITAAPETEVFLWTGLVDVLRWPRAIRAAPWPGGSGANCSSGLRLWLWSHVSVSE